MTRPVPTSDAADPSTVASATAGTTRAPRARRVPPPPKRGWQRVPVSVRVFLPVLAAVAVAWLWFEWRGTFARIAIVGLDGAPVATARLEVFPLDERPTGPSPSPSLGALDYVADGGPMTLPRELVDREALVRVDADGLGTSFAVVTANGSVTSVRLGPPVEVSGRVLDQNGRGVGAARVLALGGGPRGVLLDEVRTDLHGRFTVRGFTATIGYVFLRVLKTGFAVAELDHAIESPTLPELRVDRTKPVKGAVVAGPGADGFDAQGLTVRCYRLPGVEATTGDGGTFRLDHLPGAPMQIGIVAGPLDERWTHRRCTVSAGEFNVTLPIVPARTLRGQVVDMTTETPLAGARVYHDHGPDGRTVTVADGDGRFEIGRVPPGPVTLFADLITKRLKNVGAGRKQRRNVHLQGRIDVVPGTIQVVIEAQ